MTELQQALAVGSTIATLLDMYDDNERKKPVEDLLRVIHRMMRKRKKTNYNEMREAILIADKVWQDTVNHYADKNVSIEVISSVVSLHSLYEKQIAKFANVTQKRIDALAKNSLHKDQQSEQNAYEVTDYLLERLSEYTGVKRQSLASIKRKAEVKSNLKKMDAILEGAA